MGCPLEAIRNQQVSGSSPLAGSNKINNLQRQVIRLVWAESALSQQSHRTVSRQVFAQLARDGRSLVHGRTRPQSAPSTPPSRLGAGRCGSGRSRYDAAVERASCEKRVRPSFCLRPRGERGSADGTQRSQDDSDRHCGRGAGAAGVHGACLPVMRASTREEMRRISSTSRSSSRLFSIHSR